MTDQNARPAIPAIPGSAVVCLSLAAFGSGIALRVNDALLPRLALEFGVGLGEAAQVISFFAIAYGLAQLLFGPLGDRFGKYRVIASASVACAFTSALCAAAPGFEGLRLARLLAGPPLRRSFRCRWLGSGTWSTTSTASRCWRAS